MIGEVDLFEAIIEATEATGGTSFSRAIRRAESFEAPLQNPYRQRVHRIGGFPSLTDNQLTLLAGASQEAMGKLVSNLTGAIVYASDLKPSDGKVDLRVEVIRLALNAGNPEAFPLTKPLSKAAVVEAARILEERDDWGNLKELSIKARDYRRT